MRLNENTTLAGARCVLVPYREEHVNTYHCWMQDPALQQATASEPLSLDEEFEMQRRWRDDGDKLTFVVLDRARQPDTAGTGCHGGAMAGDVNLYFLPDDSEEEEGGEQDDEGEEGRPAGPQGEEEEEEAAAPGRAPPRRPARPARAWRTAEVEVMIAEPASRRAGLATEALTLLMAYASRRLAVGRFVAKIGAANAPSLALFSGAAVGELVAAAGMASGGGSPELGAALGAGGGGVGDRGEENDDAGGGGGGSTRQRGPKQGLGFVEFRRVPAFDEVHLALDARPGSAARASLDAVALVEGAYDDDDGGGEAGGGQEEAAEDVLHLGGGRAGALPAATGLAVLMRPVGGGGGGGEAAAGGGGGDEGELALARRLAAVAAGTATAAATTMRTWAWGLED